MLWILHQICCGSSTETQNKQYLSCYSTDFDETLKVGSWDHLNPIPHRGTSKINPTPHGGSGRNGPHYQEINCLYVFFPPIPPPSQVLVSFALSTFIKTTLLFLFNLSGFFYIMKVTDPISNSLKLE